MRSKNGYGNVIMGLTSFESSHSLGFLFHGFPWSGAWGDPFRKCTRHPISEAPDPVKNSGAPSDKSLGKPECGHRRKRQPHLGLLCDLSKGSPEFFTGACASLRGCRVYFRKGIPQTWGICEEGSPGTGDFQGVSTPLSYIYNPRRGCRQAGKLTKCL